MPARLRGQPPGRAGRVWLRRRLGVAQRGADLLDHKLRLLRTEQERFGLLVQRTGRNWEAAAREAETWLVRAALLGGERALRHAADDHDLTVVEVEWATTMGVSYPTSARCRLPEPTERQPTPDNTALLHARDAYRRAIIAAVDHAVASAAISAVDAEVVATRRRVRAIEDRWIPRLEGAARGVQIVLDEQELDDGIRLRWAARRRERVSPVTEGGPAGKEST